MENGTDVLRSLPQEYHSRIDVIRLPDTKDFPIATETISKITKGPEDVCSEHGKCSCMLCRKEGKEFSHVDLLHTPLDTIVVFDSATQLGRSIEAFLIKDQAEDYKPGWDEYNQQGALLHKFFSRIQNAPYHVIVTAHTIEADTRSKKKQLVPLVGTKNFSSTIGGYFNHIVYAEIKNRKHVFACSTTYSSNVLSGSRLGTVMEESDNPTLLSIFKPEVVPHTQVQCTSASAILEKMNQNKSMVQLPSKKIEPNIEYKDLVVQKTADGNLVVDISATVPAEVVQSIEPEKVGGEKARDILAKLRAKKRN